MVAVKGGTFQSFGGWVKRTDVTQRKKGTDKHTHVQTLTLIIL